MPVGSAGTAGTAAGTRPLCCCTLPAGESARGWREGLVQTLPPGWALPAPCLSCQDTPDAQPAAGQCWGLEGAEGWVLPREPRCHPAAKAQLGWGSVVGTRGSRREGSLEKSPRGHTPEGRERVGGAGWWRWAAAAGRGTLWGFEVSEHSSKLLSPFYKRTDH